MRDRLKYQEEQFNFMAESLSDKDYRQLLKEIMLSTQSRGEFEWAVSEIRKLNQKGAETFNGEETIFREIVKISSADFDDWKRFNEEHYPYSKRKIAELWKKYKRGEYDGISKTFKADDDSKLRQQAIDTIESRVADYTTHEDVSPYWGDGIANPNKYLYFKLRYAWNNHPDMREIIIEQYMRGIKDGSIDPANPLENSEAETFEADCRDCYGMGGLYDSRLEIDDECATCGGTGEAFEAEIYDRQGNLRTVDDNFIEATNDKLKALYRLLEANRKQILATNNQDTKTRLRRERYKIQDVMARLRAFIDDPINHDGGDFMVRLGAEALVIPDGDSVPHHIFYRLDREGIKYRFIEGDYGLNAENFEASTGDIETDRTLLKEQMQRFKDDPEMLEAIKNMVQTYGVGGALNNIEMLDLWLEEWEREEKEESERNYKKILRNNKGLTKQLKKDSRYRSPFKAETFEAESVSDLELQKDSCCCGATKKTPCVCMILGSDCSAKKPMCACFRLKTIQQKDEKGAETFEAKGDDKYYLNNRPQWMPKLMKGSSEEEGEGTYRRFDNPHIAGLFLKSVKDARLNHILKQTNYQDSDVVGFIMPFDLITRKLAKDYEPLILKDNFGKSNKYLVINGTPYNYDVFNSMLMRLPPTTEVRISGKPKYPLMFEFKFLNEHYIMFLAPYVGDDFDASQHGDYVKEVMSKSGAGFGFKKPPNAKKLSQEEAEKAFNERRDKIRKRMFYPKGSVGLYSPAKERFEKAIDGREAKTDFNDAGEWNPLLKKALPLMTDAEMEDYVLISTKGNKEDKPLTTAFFEMIVEERGEGNDPDFDPEKADRDNDGEISDWEMAVGNAVAKGIREHKEKKEAESRPVSYMVKSDAHKLNKASKRIHDKADKNREYPEWWKSKLSVVRNDADKLSDFLDYAVVEGVFESEGDHDHEEIDELIDKLNTVVDFAITFVHDGGYGGEPKGILVDEDLGIKTEVVHYVEGSIQLNLVRDIDTNELLSVRFSLTGDPDQTPIVYLPLPEEITTVPEDDRVSAKN